MKALLKKMLLLCAVLMMFLALPTVASAAANPKLVELKAGKTYTSYDINRDGKADTFKWTPYSNTSSKYGYAKLTLNGKSTDIFIARGAQIHYYRYTKTNTFLLVYCHQYGGGHTEIYRYTGTKPTRVRSADYLQVTRDPSCTGSYVYFETHPYHSDNLKTFRNVSDMDHLTFKIRYKVDTASHILAVNSLTANVKTQSKFRCLKTVQSASTYSCKDKNGITFLYGSSYTLKKIHFTSRTKSDGVKVYDYSFYLTNSAGKGGWVKETFEGQTQTTFTK